MRTQEILWHLLNWSISRQGEIQAWLRRVETMTCTPFSSWTILLHISPQGVRMAKFRTDRAPTSKVSHTRAADRGYAWLVLFVCFMIDMIYSSSYMVGIFLVEFKHHFGVSATMVSWVGGLQHSIGKIAGKCRLVMKDSSENLFP